VWETEAHGRDGHFVPWQLMKTWMKHGFILEMMMMRISGMMMMMMMMMMKFGVV